MVMTKKKEKTKENEVGKRRVGALMRGW